MDTVDTDADKIVDRLVCDLIHYVKISLDHPKNVLTQTEDPWCACTCISSNLEGPSIFVDISNNTTSPRTHCTITISLLDAPHLMAKYHQLGTKTQYNC